MPQWKLVTGLVAEAVRDPATGISGITGALRCDSVGAIPTTGSQLGVRVDFDIFVENVEVRVTTFDVAVLYARVGTFVEIDISIPVGGDGDTVRARWLESIITFAGGFPEDGDAPTVAGAIDGETGIDPRRSIAAQDAEDRERDDQSSDGQRTPEHMSLSVLQKTNRIMIVI